MAESVLVLLRVQYEQLVDCIYIKLILSLNICSWIILSHIIQLSFFLVPSDIITSATLSITPTTGLVGHSITAFCNASLSVDVFGAMIKFDYGLTSNTVAAISGTTQTDKATISSSAIIPGSEYNCTVTLTASGVCGGGESEQACPTKTSDPVTPIVERE